MKTFDYIITDELGIHARPAGGFSKLAKSYKSEVTVVKGYKKVNASKLIALMGLGIKKGDTITVTVEGADEDEAAAEIKKFLTENL